MLSVLVGGGYCVSDSTLSCVCDVSPLQSPVGNSHTELSGVELNFDVFFYLFLL